MANPPRNIYVDPSRQTRTSCTIATSGTTATVTQTSHGYSNSDTIKIQGETNNPTVLNGYHVISNVTTDTYDYTITSIADAPGAGAILASKMNLASSDGTTEALAWADLQYCCDAETAMSSDGAWIHIKNGTKEVLVETFLTSTLGAPGYNKPLNISGYQTNIKDHGVAEIDYAGVDGNLGYWQGGLVSDLEVHNGDDTNPLIHPPRYGVLYNVYAHDNGGDGISNQSNTTVAYCRVEDVGGVGIYLDQSMSNCEGCYIKQGTNHTMTDAIWARHQSITIVNNIISLDSTTDGIAISGNYSGRLVVGNTLLSTGTGTGIAASQTMAEGGSLFANNYVEGFAKAMDVTGGNGQTGGAHAGNAYYNCTTGYTSVNEHTLLIGGSSVAWENLSNSGIAKTDSDTYANRFTYFKPVASGDMLTGGYPEVM